MPHPETTSDPKNVSSVAASSQVSEDETPAERSLRFADYRQYLVEAEQKAQEDFDKTVLSLSGGALGISFVFLKDVIGPNPISGPNWLFASWVSWGASTFCVLASYYFSHLALRQAIQQVDSDTIHKQTAGGYFRGITAFLNACGAVLFLLGVCAITVFASANLKSKGVTNDGSQKATPATSAASNSSAPASAASQSSGNRH